MPFFRLFVRSLEKLNMVLGFFFFFPGLEFSWGRLILGAFDDAEIVHVEGTFLLSCALYITIPRHLLQFPPLISIFYSLLSKFPLLPSPSTHSNSPQTSV